MAPSRRFANHPGAKEAPAEAFAFKHEMGQNPVLRGWAMVAGGSLVSNSGYLQKMFWKNAGFDKPREIPGLEKEVAILNPTVIALADPSAPKEAPSVSPELFPAQAADMPGRYYSAADYHALYKSGEATPLEVAQALLGLIRAPSKYADAWRWVNEDAVLTAARASTERWAAGKPKGLLDGVPFGAKDDVDAEGYVSCIGLKVDKSLPFFNRVVTESEWSVTKLQEAGAILMGKLHMHEIGMDTSGCNPYNGTPTNWFNKSYYPGGSSSGPASALGGGLIPIAVGTDAGGSVRIPAAYNGVYGLKTSQNRLSTRNSSVCVTGPMAATVADLTAAYRTMAAANPADPTGSLWAPSVPPSPTQKKYIGVCEPWLAAATPPVREAVASLIAHLVGSQGYEKIAVSLPNLQYGQFSHAATCLAEATIEARARVVGSDRHYLSPLNYPNRLLLSIGSQTPATEYLHYGQVRAVLMRHLAHLYEKYPGIIIVSPTTPVPGWPKTKGDEAYGFSDGNMTMYGIMYAWVANTSGCPAVSAPVGYAEPDQGEGKLPVGVMGMAEWGGEESCLEFASVVEGYVRDVLPGGRRRAGEWADVLGAVKGGKGSVSEDGGK